MADSARYVFDTGVLISAALFKDSAPSQALRTAIKRGVLLASVDTLEELRQVLARPKFDRYLQASTRRRFLAAVIHRASIVRIDSRLSICRDPGDDKFLELAVNGQASAIITGDDDLLVLNPFQGIAIITPAEFLRQLLP